MTDDELKALVASLAVEHAKTEQAQRRTEVAQQKTEAAQQKTEATLRQLSREIGGLSNKFGSFTEGLALPSMSQILTERFHVQVVGTRVVARRGAKSLEIDVLAYSNGAHNSVYVVEVKSHLNEEALEQISKTLAEFPKFFPEHKSKELYGILAGVHVPENVARSALKAGIYVARISNEVFRLQVPAGFRPHSFKR